MSIFNYDSYRPCCLHFKGPRVQEELTLSLKMEASGAFETSVTIYHMTQRYISEDLNFHQIPPGMSVSRLKFEPVILHMSQSVTVCANIC